MFVAIAEPEPLYPCAGKTSGPIRPIELVLNPTESPGTPPKPMMIWVWSLQYKQRNCVRKTFPRDRRRIWTETPEGVLSGKDRMGRVHSAGRFRGGGRQQPGTYFQSTSTSSGRQPPKVRRETRLAGFVVRVESSRPDAGSAAVPAAGEPDPPRSPSGRDARTPAASGLVATPPRPDLQEHDQENDEPRP